MRKLIAGIMLVLLAAGCIDNFALPGTKAPDGSNSNNNAVPGPTVLDTPQKAAEAYASETFFNTDTVTFSEFSFTVQPGTATEVPITIRFRRVLTTPQYDLIRVMEQTVTTEKRGAEWAVSDTPNARIVSESFDYKNK